MQQTRLNNFAEAINLDALSVALQHSAVAADQQNICRLLQVCKSWRRTVQQSDTSVTNVKIEVKQMLQINKPADVSLNKLALFGFWLSAHAGMVGSIQVDVKAAICAGGPRGAAAERAVEQYLSATITALAKHVSASVHRTSAAAAAIAAVAAPAMAAARLQPLRLQSFSLRDPAAGPEILSALPADTLTHLSISVSCKQCTATCEALQRLTSLRRLELLAWQSGCLPPEYVSALHQLSRVTSLYLYPLQDSAPLEMLPPQLSNLTLNLPGCDVAGESPRPKLLDLSHLTELRHLELETSVPIAAGSALPHQLQELQLYAPTLSFSALGVSALSQLQRLRLRTEATAVDLLCLTELPALQHVGLTCSRADVTLMQSLFGRNCQSLS